MPASSNYSADLPASIDTFQRFKRRLLKGLLLVGTAALLIVWFVESQSNRLMFIDSVAYPLLIIAFTTYFIIIQLRPETLPIFEVLSFVTLTIYELIYVYALIYHMIPIITIYDMATFTQWFPLVYTGAFMFLRTRDARIASIIIYLVMLFPTIHQHLFNNSPFMSNEISALLLNMNIAHPVYIVVLAGIAELKENFVQARSDADNMRIAANIDYLTGVANRRATVKLLQELIDKAPSTKQGVAVLLIDIDYFKHINDTFGHDSGDLVLIAFAHAIRTILPTQVLFGRWGGEEFLAMTMTTTQAEAVQLAERLRSELEQVAHQEVGQVTASIGVAMLASNDTLEALVKRADQALYRAKQNGRNRIEIEE